VSGELQPVTFEVLAVPPSLNSLMQSKGLHWAYRKAKHEWEKVFLAKLTEAEMPRCARVVVEGEVTFPTRIRRDQGNFRFLTEKALGDALVAGGWLPDDDWTRFEFGGFAMRYERRVKRLRLMLFPTALEVAA
jgi:hypothetical protein